MYPRLQPYASQAATLCIPGCNPMSNLRTRIAASSGLASSASGGLVAATARDVYRGGGARAFYLVKG